ncbi:MAG: ATP-binding protein [Verrucomicrobiota bacterium]|nr:ATP-binding protein [Limisphaera sp.]MDW8381971.1 ATP-binding protein [Verrucomicrobiota bacterium]
MHANTLGWLHRAGVWTAVGWLCGFSPQVLVPVARAVQASTDFFEHAGALEIEGIVLWADPTQQRLALWDGHQVRLWEVHWGGHPWSPGLKVRAQGQAVVRSYGPWQRVTPLGPVVDNDGVHAIRSKSGSVFLTQGRHPFRLEWFNATDAAHLEVIWSGPGIPEGRIPATAYVYDEMHSGGHLLWHPGLRYEVFAVAGEQLPDWTRLQIRQDAGTCAEPDVSVVSGRERVGVLFSGFLNVPETGVWRFTLRSDDGSRLYVGEPSMRWEVLGREALPTPRMIWPGQPIMDDVGPFWAVTEGRLLPVGHTGRGWRWELKSGLGRMRLEASGANASSLLALQGDWVQMTGVCLPVQADEGPAVAGVLLAGQSVVTRRATVGSGTSTEAHSAKGVLRTAAEVHRLSREEAARGIRVRLEGTVTCQLPEHQAVVIQDHTRGLYVVDWSDRGEGLPHVGDRVQVEGRTDPGLFAPMVNAWRVDVTGLGPWPEPVLASWESLNNGSLDAQWVELRGWITAVHSNRIWLLLREGLLEIELRLREGRSPPPAVWEDSLIRLRGCLFASWDYQTHQVRPGVVRLYGAEVFVEQSPPEDPFALPVRSARSLRLFDPSAGLFQRIRVTGQLLLRDQGSLLLVDNGVGFRVQPRQQEIRAQPGDHLEVVGIPDLTVPELPVLRQAVVRVTGRGPLPEPFVMADDHPAGMGSDLRRLEIEGTLVDRRTTERGCIFALQQGWHSLTVRWAREDPPPDTALGSRVRLVGVWVPGPVDTGVGMRSAGAEVLVGPADTWQVMAQPPFWTLERSLVALGVLASVLLLAVLWITQLHRQVERRGAALEREIRTRQRLEQQQALEQERARVARDLHDELGSDLTEIAMLLERAQAAQASLERCREYLTQATAKARQTVAALDEIVWAMNPRHDTVGSLVSYLCLHAERFLGLAGIAWRLDNGQAPQDLPVDSPRRHHLFLAFKEALNNVVRHAGATEVCFRLDVAQDHLVLTVRDNGRGLSVDSSSPDGDGLHNLRVRCEKLGGRLVVESQPGQGTTLQFCLPLAQPA